jgi:hypothetical protein
MGLSEYEQTGLVRLARWAARGISLLYIGLLLALLVFNEDFRVSSTLPTIILWLLVLSTLIAWRWETAGGLLTLFLSPVFLLSLFVQWSGSARFVMSIWELALIGICLMFPFLVTGLLFVYIGR